MRVSSQKKEIDLLTHADLMCVSSQPQRGASTREDRKERQVRREDGSAEEGCNAQSDHAETREPLRWGLPVISTHGLARETERERLRERERGPVAGVFK